MVIAMIKQFLALELPDFIMNIVVDTVVKALSAQLKVAHLVFFDVLSPTRPLNTNQVAAVVDFMDKFPNTNIGGSLTWMDMLYPFLYMFDGLYYKHD